MLYSCTVLLFVVSERFPSRIVHCLGGCEISWTPYRDYSNTCKDPYEPIRITWNVMAGFNVAVVQLVKSQHGFLDPVTLDHVLVQLKTH